MPHAAIYWCNITSLQDAYKLIKVSMPHAAIYWCNHKPKFVDARN